jgi:peptidase E
MDKLIINKLNSSNSLYMACSAGAILTGETIFPASILRFNQKSKIFHINNSYKPNFLTKKKNQKGLKLIKKMDFMPHCTLNNKKKILKLKESKKIYCLSENNVFIK